MDVRGSLMKNHSYKSLKAFVNAPNYIIDIRKFEVYFSLVCSIVLTLLSYFIITESDTYIVQFINYSRSLILSSAIGLIGMLGFIISGLAIISGTVGNKVTRKMIEQKKYKSLLS
ncbi:hypothetical protein, partial [Virgibacillus sp. DJP39]|uniref:hypothetical protein n=1 Tax=Virgibacillus sp. DJP39 TaxID=3409790 RepID=UPI003BB63C08